MSVVTDEFSNNTHALLITHPGFYNVKLAVITKANKEGTRMLHLAIAESSYCLRKITLLTNVKRVGSEEARLFSGPLRSHELRRSHRTDQSA